MFLSYLLQFVLLLLIRKGRIGDSITVDDNNVTPALTYQQDNNFENISRNNKSVTPISDSIETQLMPQTTNQNTKSIFPKQELVLRNYVCKKCHFTKYHKGNTHETSGFIAKLINLHNRKFQTISCNRCGFTEYYEQSQHFIFDLFDIMMR
ncbi:hypothetical protein ABK040_002820 [Willaertia magna]